MSVRFMLVQMFDSMVRPRFPTVCQNISTRRGLPEKREPKTTSAWPSMMGWMSFPYSFGSYSRSASWMMTMSPVRVLRGSPDGGALTLVLLLL